jgi:hypothetical protein
MSDKNKSKNQDKSKGEVPAGDTSAAQKVASEARIAANGGSLGGGLCWHFVEQVLKNAGAMCFHDQPENKGKQSYAFTASSPWGKPVPGAKVGYIAVFVGTKWKVERAAKSRAFPDKKNYGPITYKPGFSEKGHVGIVTDKQKGYWLVAGQNVSRSWLGKKDKKPDILVIPTKAQEIEIEEESYWYKYSLTNRGQVYYFMPLKFTGDRHACDKS